MGSHSQAASSTRLSARYTRATSRLEALAAATLVAVLGLLKKYIKLEWNTSFKTQAKGGDDWYETNSKYIQSMHQFETGLYGQTRENK